MGICVPCTGAGNGPAVIPQSPLTMQPAVGPAPLTTAALATMEPKERVPWWAWVLLAIGAYLVVTE